MFGPLFVLFPGLPSSIVHQEESWYGTSYFVVFVQWVVVQLAFDLFFVFGRSTSFRLMVTISTAPRVLGVVSFLAVLLDQVQQVVQVDLPTFLLKYQV